MNVNAVVERGEVLRALQAQSAARVDARAEALEVMVREFVRQLVRRSPNDTNRYDRGWIEAANQLGLNPTPMPPLVPSRFRERQRARLEGQVAFWTARLEYWTLRQRQAQRADASRGVVRRGPRAGQLKAARTSQPYYLQTVLPKQRQAEALLRRAVDELEKFESDQSGATLVVYRRTNRRSRTVRTTVRDRAFGGRGRWRVVGGETFAVLENLEPHVRLVEARTAPVRTSLAVVRSFGVRRASRKYLDGLARRSGLQRVA